MSLSKFERHNTIKTEIDFKMNDTLTDPSGSVAFVDVIKSDGTYFIEDASTTRDGVGEYSYYFTPSETDPLGVWVVIWHGYHNLGGSYGYKKITQRDAIQVVDVEQD